MIIHAVVDTETTGLLKPKAAGLSAQPKIIELCVVRIDAAGQVLSEHEWLINPGEAITDEITKITGIKNEDLVGKPTFAELLPQITEAFQGALTFIAHNAPFDRGMLRNDIERCGAELLAAFPWPLETICTVQSYRHEYGRRMKLTELYEKKVGKPLAQTHRALDDVKALIEVLVADKFFETFNDDPSKTQD